MVISKRCKICTTLDPSNVPIANEYFGRRLPDIITKICGIELDSRKLCGVLVCQQCSIMLVHTDCVIDKLRKSVQRLAMPIKSIKTPRTASKETNEAGVETPPKATKVKRAKVNEDTLFKKISNGNQSQHGTAQIDETDTRANNHSPHGYALNEKRIPGENAKRKLAYHENITAASTASVTKKAKHKAHILEFNDDSYAGLNESNGQDTYSISLDNENEANTEETNIMVNQRKEKKTKDINCVLCEKKFNQKRELREHIEANHMGEKLKECPNCFMEFRSVQKYESHIFSEKCKTTLHPCQVENCNRRFKNTHKMEEHMKEKHHSANDTDAD